MGSCFQGTPKEVFLVLPTFWCPLSMHGEIAGKPKVEKQKKESVRQIRLSRRTRETQVFKLPQKVSHSGARGRDEASSTSVSCLFLLRLSICCWTNLNYNNSKTSSNIRSNKSKHNYTSSAKNKRNNKLHSTFSQLL